MKNIIFGNSHFAFVFYESAIKEGLDIKAFTVNRKYICDKNYDNKPIIPFEDLENLYSIKDCRIYLCIGYKHMNKWRERLFNNLKNKGYTIGHFYHSSSSISSKIEGEGNILLERVIIGSKTNIGDCNIFYPGAIIAHNSTIGNYNYFSISTSIAGNCNIGNNCFFGNNSTTKDGLTIGDSVLVGAGAFANSNLLKEQVIVPAKSLVLENYKSTNFFID